MLQLVNNKITGSYLTDFITRWTKNGAAMKPVLGGNRDAKHVPGVKALKCCTAVQDDT